MRKRFDVDIPDGHRLGFSHDEAGAFRAHIFDSESRLVGHANLFEVHEEDSDYYAKPDSYETRGQREYSDEEIAELIEGLVFLGVLAIAAVERVAVEMPRIRLWWKTRVLPAVFTMLETPRRIANRQQNRIAASASMNVRLAFEKYRSAREDPAARNEFVNAILSKIPANGFGKSMDDNKLNSILNQKPQGIGSPNFNRKSIGEHLSWLLEENPDIISDESIRTLREISSGMRLGRAPIRLEIEN